MSSLTREQWDTTMAQIFPNDLTPAFLKTTNRAEIETLVLLRDRLPDDWTVYHGVHWSRMDGPTKAIGEVDFVVVNPVGDVLLIEQKNGRLDEDGEALYKVYPFSRKNVGIQIRRSVAAILTKYEKTNRGAPQLNVDYLIYCPDHNVTLLNAASLDADRVVDAQEKDRLAEHILAIHTPAEGAADRGSETVHQFLRQTLRLVPDVQVRISGQERHFVRLSSGLADVVANIEMHPLRLRVSGTAGCGKSQVALSTFEAAQAAGRRPLLVTFSRPLKERLNALLGHPTGEEGLVSTWYGLLDGFLQAHGRRLDFEMMRTDPGFWARAAAEATTLPVPDDWRFDTLIVDEGQDFEQGWVNGLCRFLNPDHDVLWLEDRDQDLYSRPPVDLPGFITYRARENFRSPAHIAALIQRSLPFDFKSANPFPGYEVGHEVCADPEKLPGVVGRLIDRLVSSGFRDHDIVVLSCRGTDSSSLRDSAKAGRFTLRRFTGSYDMFGNQLMTEGRILTDSVYRFKGQQAPAVILVDVDPAALSDPKAQRLLYCGMTRATVRLDMVLMGTGRADERSNA